MIPFLTLVRNDLYFHNKFTHKKLVWFRIYFGVAVILAFFQYTMFLRNTNVEELQPIKGLWVLLIFYFFILSIRLIIKEWEKNTAGWWLSLPYPRIVLLGAKLTAACLRCFRSIVIFSFISVLMYFEALFIRPDLLATADVKINLISHTLRIIGFIGLLTPITILFGMITGLMHQSKWKPAAPFFWIFFPAVSLAFLKAFGINTSTHHWGANTGLMILADILLISFLTWIAKKLLESHVEN